MSDPAFQRLKPIKLLIIGDSTAGKTCLLQRYTDNDFSGSFITTIGIDFRSKIVTCKNVKQKVTIWDTAGQERFRNITRAYYRGSMGILLVYDISNRKSFENINRWMKEIRGTSSEDVEVMILGNKCDLIEERKVTFEEGQTLADSYGLAFFETSAKVGTNVNLAFQNLIETIYDKMENAQNEIQKSSTVVIDQIKKPNGCSCNKN